MKRALLLLVAVLIVAALLFATCGERPHDPSNPKRSLGGGDAPEATKPVPRKRTDAPVADEKPAEAPKPTVPAPSRDATTTLMPSDAKVAAPTHVLRGRVVNRRGEPVADAEVRLFSMWLPSELAEERGDQWGTHAESRVKTAADGSFALTYFEGGPRGVVVEVQGARRAQLHGLSDDRVHEIVIDDAKPSLLVHVTRADDGSAVTDADVALLLPVTPVAHPMKSPGGWTYPDVKSIAPGTWRISQGPVGPALLTVRAPGLAPDTERHVEMRADREDTVEVVLKKGAVVRGVVLDAVTNAPIAGAKIEMPQGWYAGRLETETDADGKFVIDDVPLDPRTFRTFAARADGYAPASFLAGGLADGATECEATVRLFREAKAALRCVDPDGRPVAAALVALWSDYDVSPPKGLRSFDASLAAATTGADGRATIVGLHPGTDGLELRARFYVEGVAVLERTFPALVAGETRDLGDVVLAPTLTLRGVVLDADGKPFPGAVVVAAVHDVDDRDHAAIGTAVIERGGRRAETGPDGAFALMGLSAGLWDVYASDGLDAPGRLELGVDPRVGAVTLHLPRIVALEGRVVDGKGAPVAKAAVVATHEAFGLRMSVQCLTLDDGRFRVPGFAADAGEVEVSVTAPGSAAQTFRARPGVAGTELRLRP